MLCTPLSNYQIRIIFFWWPRPTWLISRWDIKMCSRQLYDEFNNCIESGHIYGHVKNEQYGVMWGGAASQPCTNARANVIKFVLWTRYGANLTRKAGILLVLYTLKAQKRRFSVHEGNRSVIDLTVIYGYHLKYTSNAGMHRLQIYNFFTRSFGLVDLLLVLEWYKNLL